jgi:hypothetical protein
MRFLYIVYSLIVVIGTLSISYGGRDDRRRSWGHSSGSSRGGYGSGWSGGHK